MKRLFLILFLFPLFCACGDDDTGFELSNYGWEYKSDSEYYSETYIVLINYDGKVGYSYFVGEEMVSHKSGHHTYKHPKLILRFDDGMTKTFTVSDDKKYITDFSGRKYVKFSADLK